MAPRGNPMVISAADELGAGGVWARLSAQHVSKKPVAGATLRPHWRPWAGPRLCFWQMEHPSRPNPAVRRSSGNCRRLRAARAHITGSHSGLTAVAVRLRGVRPRASPSAVRPARSTLTWARTHLGPAARGQPAVPSGLSKLVPAGAEPSPARNAPHRPPGSAAGSGAGAGACAEKDGSPAGEGAGAGADPPRGWGRASNRSSPLQPLPRALPPIRDKGPGLLGQLWCEEGEQAAGVEGSPPPRAPPSDMPPAPLTPWSRRSRSAYSTW